VDVGFTGGERSGLNRTRPIQKKKKKKKSHRTCRNDTFDPRAQTAAVTFVYYYAESPIEIGLAEIIDKIRPAGSRRPRAAD